MNVGFEGKKEVLKNIINCQAISVYAINANGMSMSCNLIFGIVWFQSLVSINKLQYLVLRSNKTVVKRSGVAAFLFKRI